ncbi:protein phosphatase 2C [Nitzschia inconspicua]|uniref:Protein phosphatase 2C n=1 Tax=Nitzschia inconspicua TaxID=303405 RepID=A0A9K3LR79_9STRA|nr:protein phosphatase 2C [Nitzschia inconspicua]
MTFSSHKVEGSEKYFTASRNGDKTFEEDGDKHAQSDDKGHTFRKRRLSLTNLRNFESDGEEHLDDDELNGTVEKSSSSPADAETLSVDTEERGHSFRKRRLSLTHTKHDDEGVDEQVSIPKRRRRNSENSVDTINSNSSNLKSRTAHATELLSHPPPSPSISSTSVPILYQQAAPPQQPPLLDTFAGNGSVPKWKKRHTRHADEKSLPFPRDIVGTFSCHGVEPIYDSDYQPEVDDQEDDDDWVVGRGSFLGDTRLPGSLEESDEKPTMMAKTNQDRGGIAFPYGNCAKTALFAVYDGHGHGGELVSQYALHEVQRLLEKHEDFNTNIEKAFKDTFTRVDSSLKDECLIEPLYAGTTACVALLRDKQLVLSNVGDSRSVLAKRKGDSYEAIDLTQDQNPDLPQERERIEGMGGFVSPPPEPGLSARVWLDEKCTQIGLAMARSIGDHAVKPIGVIAEPVVTFHEVQPEDDFVILATDGVWEFISSSEAVKIVSKNLSNGSTKACRALIEAAAARWHDEEGEYRDDITAIIIRLQHLWGGPGPKKPAE